MSYKIYRIYKAIVIFVIALIIGWAVPAGNAFVPVPAAIIGMLILLFLRRRVKEITVDERTYNISNRASRAAFQIVTLIMVLIGATLIALGNEKYPEVSPVGFTLIYSAAGFLVVYLISYAFYGKKLGGANYE